MTIALGFRCDGGVILSADTNVVLSDGSATEGEKVSLLRTSWGHCAIANASDDANATKTLIRSIQGSLEESRSMLAWDEFEGRISYEMTHWSQAFKERPFTSLIVGACILGVGVEMYLCEPPNTVLPHSPYVAAEAGEAVTDPLFSTFFKSNLQIYQDPQRTLRQMAYLMYRAKKDSALCGGKTHAIYVREDGAEPEWVRSPDFESAEAQSRKLDFLLKAAAQFALLSEEGTNLEANAKGLGEMLIGLAGLRAVRFRNPNGLEISAEAHV